MALRRWDKVKLSALSQGERESLLADLDLRRGGNIQPASNRLTEIHALEPDVGATILGDGSVWTTNDDAASTWTAYTPTIAAGAGTFASVAATGKHLTVGKTVQVLVSIVITTNDTAATDITATLPSASLNACVIHGAQTAGAFGSVKGTVAAAASLMRITRYDGTYPGADGYTIVMSGTYETS